MAEVPTRNFSLDTSSLVNSWNRIYQIDMIPSIWEHVEAVLAKGTAVVTIQVYEEIEKKDDALFGWCKERKELFTSIDDTHIDRLSGLMDRHPRIAAAGSGRNYADPWVVSLAQCFNPPFCVVTEEGSSRNANNPKIPYICDQEGLRSCTFNEFYAKRVGKSGVK